MALEILNSEIVIVSDIHMVREDDERGQLLLKLLDHISGQVRQLIFNGDIFDFCFGKGPYFRRKFKNFGEKLRVLSDNGTQIVFIEGNHEFSMINLGWTWVKFVTDHTYKIKTIDGQEIALTHGDLIKEDPRYQKFRAFLKSKQTEFLAGLLPSRVLDAYALSHARMSRARDPYRMINHEDVVNAAFEWLEKSGVTMGVFGHYHVPYAEFKRKAEKTLRIFCVESWDKPNLLAFRDCGFSRAYLKDWESLGSWKFVKPKAFLP